MSSAPNVQTVYLKVSLPFEYFVHLNILCIESEGIADLHKLSNKT